MVLKGKKKSQEMEQKWEANEVWDRKQMGADR